MDARTKAQYTQQAKILKALAHPSRLFVVQLLSDRKRCVCELARMVGADISTVSKHLSVLKNVGILEGNKQGTTVYYKLKTPCVLNFLGCVKTVMKSNARQQLQLLK